MTLREEQSQFVSDIGKLIRFADLIKGVSLTFGEGKVYAERSGYIGQTLASFKDAVHKMGGFHYKGLAIDFNLFVNGVWIADGKHPYWTTLGNYWISLSTSNTWGGKWGDANHFSRGETA